MRKSYSIVEIDWHDCSGKASWHELEDAQKAKPIPIKTVGYLIKKDKANIILVGSFDHNELVSDRTIIPRSLVNGIKTLGKSPRPR